MKHFLVIVLLGLISFPSFASNPERTPKGFISIEGTLGRHDVHFKTFAHSPGLSFGFKASLGFYIHSGEQWRWGLYYGLVEGASFNEDRRQLSEDFVLPNTDFDKHIVYKFAMFRSSHIGWHQELVLSKFASLNHQIGFGIFGLTENNPLYNLGVHNSIGLSFGKNPRLKWQLGLIHDAMIGTGNPNYGVNNIGLVFGVKKVL